MEVGPLPPAGPPVPPPVTGSDRTNPWALVAAVLTGCWAVLLTLVGQFAGWGVDQAVLAAGLDRAVRAWPLVALGTVLLVGAPTLALALLPRAPAVRATGRVWLAGTLALGALTVLRA
ncbi:MAG: peptidase S8, partial [Micromonospora sp.]